MQERFMEWLLCVDELNMLNQHGKIVLSNQNPRNILGDVISRFILRIPIYRCTRVPLKDFAIFWTHDVIVR